MKKILIIFALFYSSIAFGLSSIDSNLILVQSPAKNLMTMERDAIEEIAVNFAPIFITDLFQYDFFGKKVGRCKYNIPIEMSFDGNWNPMDNKKNYDAFVDANPPVLAEPDKYLDDGIGNVYFSAVSSETHVFATYHAYFPYDAGDDCWFMHDSFNKAGTTVTIMLIIRDDGIVTEPEWMIARVKGSVDEYPLSKVAFHEDRPLVYIINGKHDVKKVNVGDLIPSPDVTYSFGLDDDYDLLPVDDTLWPQRGNNELFCRFENGIGTELCNGIFSTQARAPWSANLYMNSTAAPGLAQNFFDPIGAFEHLYNKSSKTYSKTYTYNPYIGYLD